MTKEEANKIFKSWQDHMEIAGKLSTVFPRVPESFLPYPSKLLEEALNIVAKDYFDAGNFEAAKDIQSSMGLYLSVIADEEALQDMKENLDFILKHTELKNITLNKLKEAQESWVGSRN